MKTFILTTRDGLEFRLTDSEAHGAMKALDEKKPVYIEENRITNADLPTFRKIRMAPVSLISLAPGVFEKSPRYLCYEQFVFKWAAELRKKHMVVQASLIDWCAEELGSWDADMLVSFMQSNWDKIQEYNVSVPLVRIDRSSSAPFIPENRENKRCGKCINGFLPGNDGLRFCSCNPVVREKHFEHSRQPAHS